MLNVVSFWLSVIIWKRKFTDQKKKISLAFVLISLFHVLFFQKSISPIDSSSSCSRFSKFWHLHIPEHFHPFFLHLHSCVLHPALHPHIVKCIMLSGAGGSSVVTASCQDGELDHFHSQSSGSDRSWCEIWTFFHATVV